MLHATLWKNRLERTNRVFRNKSFSMEEVVESIVWSVLELVCSKTEFMRVALEDLNRFWPIFFKGGWGVKSFNRISWERPPLGVLKLKL